MGSVFFNPAPQIPDPPLSPCQRSLESHGLQTASQIRTNFDDEIATSLLINGYSYKEQGIKYYKVPAAHAHTQ